MFVFRPKQTRMPEAEKKKRSSSRTAWERLDNRLAQGHDLIQKKRESLHKLEAEKEASTNDEERKYLTTSIKAAQLDLEQDVLFFQGLEEDKAAVEEELENGSDTETTEEDEDEVNSSKRTTRGEAFTRKEVDEMLKTEVERRMREEKQDASLTATNSRMDRLITALSEARGPSSGGAEATLPAPGQTLRPVTSAQAGRPRNQDF